MIDHWELEVTTTATRPAKLTEILEGAGASVRQGTDSLFLTDPYIRPGDTHEVALQRAKKLVLSFNFLIRRLHGTQVRIVLKDLVGFNADGGRYLFASAHDGIVFSCEVEIEARNAKGELIPAPELPTDRWKDLLLEDTSVSTVCELLSHSSLGWNDLYRSLEIIAEDVGGNHKIVELGWATKESLRRFKHTANSPATIGLDARHGVDQGEPPLAPMIHSEAVALLETLVYQWMWSKT